MVKFNQKLAANIVPEWQEYYMDYTMLKKRIKETARAGERRTRKPSGVLAEIRTSLLQGQRTSPLIDGFATDDFYASALAEAEKVERFYRLRMRHATEEWMEHRTRLEALVPPEPLTRSESDSDAPQGRDNRGFRSRSSIGVDDDARERAQNAARELYRNLTQLRNYCIVNYTGFYKITKKYAKACSANAEGAAESGKIVSALMSRVHECGFAGKDGGSGFVELEALIEQIELSHAAAFTHGRVDEARHRLLTRKWQPTDWRTFRRGLNLGVMLQLMLWVTWAIFMESNILRSPIWETVHTSSAWMVVQLPVYRGIGCLTLAAWCWGACLFFWGVGRVNYGFLFEFDERSRHRSHSEVFDWAVTWTQWFLLNFLFFFKSLHGVSPISVSASVFPLLLFASAFGLVGCTSATSFAFGARTLRRIVLAPFTAVTFWDSFAADALTSLVGPMTDLAYSACYFGSGEWLQVKGEERLCETSTVMRQVVRPLIAALPLWWRLCQNLHQYHATHTRFPWLLNALKYATSLTVVIFGVFHPQIGRRGDWTFYRIAYLSAFVGSTLFSFVWDVTMDWKLIELAPEPRGSPRYQTAFPERLRRALRLPRLRLRSRRMFGGSSPYIMAVCLDFFLRFAWTTTLMPSERMLRQMPSFFPLISPFTAAGEVLRRGMWSVLRVESEHLSTEGFRRVQAVPLDFDDTYASRRETKEAYVEQQKRSRSAVISEIVIFAVVVLALSTTAILTRSRAMHQTGATTGEVDPATAGSGAAAAVQLLVNVDDFMFG